MPPDVTLAARSSTGPPAALLQDVAFRYPTGTTAVMNVTLGIDQGDRLAITGPSGCGKSTLLCLLAGFLKPSSGTVAVHTAASTSRIPIAMAFQSDTLFPWLTVAENATLFARFQKRSKMMKESRKDVTERVRWLLEVVGLGKSADVYPYQLSGGMKRRAAFVTAVAPLPQILLMDEPFSSVDEPSRIGIHQDVLNVADQLKMTMVLVTHDLAEAVSLCDDVIVLTSGPGRIAWRRHIPFGRDRQVLKMRHEPAFLETYGELWEKLSEQMVQRPLSTDTMATGAIR